MVSVKEKNWIFEYFNFIYIEYSSIWNYGSLKGTLIFYDNIFSSRENEKWRFNFPLNFFVQIFNERLDRSVYNFIVMPNFQTGIYSIWNCFLYSTSIFENTNYQRFLTFKIFLISNKPAFSIEHLHFYWNLNCQLHEFLTSIDFRDFQKTVFVIIILLILFGNFPVQTMLLFLQENWYFRNAILWRLFWNWISHPL